MRPRAGLLGSCCTGRGRTWPQKIGALVQVNVIILVLLLLIVIGLAAVAGILYSALAPAKALMHDAQLTLHKVDASKADVLLDDVHNLLTSQGVQTLTGRWGAIGLETLMTTLAELMANMDTSSLNILANPKTLEHVRHLLVTVDIFVQQLQSEPALRHFDAARFLHMLGELENATSALSHGGVTIQLGGGGRGP